MIMVDISSFKLTADDFGHFGRNLDRPECVWIDDDGIWCSDNRGGVALVAPDGPPRLLGHGIQEPNGFSRRKDGSFVVAGLGDGKAHHIAPDGTTTALLDSIGGRPLGGVNTVWADGERTWISVMTPDLPYHDAFDMVPRGYIILMDDSGARIVADGLHFTNEIKVSPDGAYLYAVESIARRIVRFPIRGNGDLGPREAVGPQDLGPGHYIDGFAFDEEGNVWLTLVMRNGIGVIDTNGRFHVVFEDTNEEKLAVLTERIERGTGDAIEILLQCGSGPLPFVTSLAFGGPDGRTVFMGSLPSQTLYTFRAPVAGARRR
jgi:sugar lactone lactonase YvrE